MHSFIKSFEKAKDWLKNICPDEKIRVIGHSDADGISGVAIIVKALNLLNLKSSVVFLKQLSNNDLELLSKEKDSHYIFVDIGSEKISFISSILEHKKALVLDHHHYGLEQAKNVLHLNPNIHGLEGGKEISGSGMAYLFAKNLSLKNIDSSFLGLVGAIGDGQADPDFSLINKMIVKDFLNTDISLYKTFFQDCSLDILNDCRFKFKKIKQFVTLLNACGKFGKAELGLKACLGDQEAKREALNYIEDYRSSIHQSLEWFKQNRHNKKIISGKGFTIINAEKNISSGILGPVIGILSRSEYFDDGNYLLGIAQRGDDEIKASIRFVGNYKESIDLRLAIKKISQEVNGDAGGHKHAAGAIFSSEYQDKFLDIAKTFLANINLKAKS